MPVLATMAERCECQPVHERAAGPPSEAVARAAQSAALVSGNAYWLMPSAPQSTPHDEPRQCGGGDGTCAASDHVDGFVAADVCAEQPHHVVRVDVRRLR